MEKLSRKIIFNILAVIFIFIFFEFGCYIILKLPFFKPKNVRDWRTYYETSGLYENVDKDLFYEEGKMSSRMAFDFYRYFRPEGKFEGKYISTTADGFRNTVQYFKNDKSLPKKTIVFLGASTMWGAGTAGDFATIPSLFAKYINALDPHVNYEVKNYGVGGYHNAQQMILLMEKLETEKIDFVIFFDWTSEAVMGYREMIDSSNKSYFLQPSVNVGYGPMIKFLTDRGVYDGSINFALGFRNFIEKSNIVRAILRIRDNAQLKRKAHADVGKDSGELKDGELRQVERIIKHYRKNKKIIGSFSASFKFTPFFIMQPNLYTKDRLSKYEATSPFWENSQEVAFNKKLYDAARREFGGDDDFYDVSTCMATEATVYLDDHHMSLRGNELCAKAILDKIGDKIIQLSR